MIKPDSLRAHLTEALPDLKRNPERLLVFIDRGSLVANFGATASFEYQYTLNLILTEFAGHPDGVMVPLLVWLQQHQPELLLNPSGRGQITFEADILDHGKVDLDIKIPLTERVGVRARPGGGFDVEHYPEPPVTEPALTAEHWQVFLRDELIAEWHVPPR